MQTRVKDIMKPDPVIIEGEATLREAAEKMRAVDCGVLPVGKWDKLEGMITDRDIVVRGVAEGVDTDSALVRDYMTSDVFYCDEDDTLEEAADAMREHHVSRLAVRDSTDKACGIVTFGCMMRKHSDKEEIGNVVECAMGRKAA